MLQPGTKAPEFTLSDQDGQAVSLADHQGHWVLLWWYPKASTSG
jgi:peroxiredoxin Q/BCP